MKPFLRLFRKGPATPPPPPTLQERIAALPGAPGEVVAAAALGGDEDGLRVAAVRLLPDGDALRALAGLVEATDGAAVRTPQKLRLAAHERLAHLIDEGAIDFAEFCAGRTRQPETLAVAALCRGPDRLGQALARIDDPAVLARLACEGPSSRVRQAAATAIEDPAQLRDLLQPLRARDKAAYRIVKQKCDAIAAEKRKAEEFAREADVLCTALERLSKRIPDPLYAASLEVLTAQWLALPRRPDPDLDQRGQAAIERCRAIIAARESDIARQVSEIALRQEAAAARARALEAEQREAAERIEAAARALAAVTAAREAEELARAEQRAAQDEVHRQIGSLIRLANDALQGGSTRRAARFRLELEETLRTAPTLPSHLTRRLQQLDEKLNELRQWKDYAVAPKRIEVIEEMEALAGSQEEPEALAERIRALQQEWRTINKGIASGDSEETERFQRAFQAAFKPCQEYFALQAAVRRENLENRKRILERLQAFEASQDAEHADRSLLRQVLREAPREWRSHSPVDREAGRSLQVEFDQSMDRLRTILTAWYERNEAEKKTLIAQARHLSTAQDTTQGIDAVQQLQVRWKETGPASREQAQTLWDEFRDLCDAVYRRRDQAYALHAAALEATKTQATTLCEQIEQAGSAPVEDRPAAKAKTAEWRTAFEALGELPRADARSLHERFERAVTRYEAGLAEQDRKDSEAAMSKLFEAGRHIRAYERVVLQNAESVQRESLRSTAEAFIAGVRRWPKGGLQAVKHALAQATAASDPDYAARERALRELCIRSEILGSTPTPPEDAALRRAYQMGLLLKGVGQVSETDDRDWESMLVEWIGIGAIAPEAHDDLERRFMGCMARRPAKSGTTTPAHGRDGGERQPRRDQRGRSGTHRPR
jgi:hypothetical protein